MMIRRYFFIFLPLLLGGLLVGLGKTAVFAAPTTTTSDALPNWGTAVSLTSAASAPFGASQPVIAASPTGPTVTVLFQRQMAAQGTNNDIWVRRSFDSGVTWLAPTPVYSSAADSIQTAVVLDNQGTAHAVWWEDNSLAYANEAAWGSGVIQRLSNPVPIQSGFATPAIAAGKSGLLAIVWAERGSGNPNIQMTKSADGGQTWSTPAPILATPPSSLLPHVAIDDNDVIHVVWQEHDQTVPPGQPVPGTINYVHSLLAGWSTPVKLTQVMGVGDGLRPRVLTTAKGVHVAFVSQFFDTDGAFARLNHLSCLAQCEAGQSWIVSPQLAGGLTFASDVPIRPSLAIYQGCPVVYFHGVRTDLPTEPNSVWGGSSCADGLLLDRVTVPPAAGVNPQLVTRPNGLAYLVYEAVGATENQIAFVRSQFRLLLPYLRGGQ